MESVPKVKNGRAFVQGDGLLGLLTCAALREGGYDVVYCSGIRIRRSEFIDRFGAIPLYNGESSILRFLLRHHDSHHPRLIAALFPI